jgi:hypothetical protein
MGLVYLGCGGGNVLFVKEKFVGGNQRGGPYH